MSCRRRGESLIELIVALLLLEIAGTFALATALSVERLGRRSARGANQDRARWEQYRAAEVATGCQGATDPAAVALTFPQTPERLPLATTLRCGP